jgi:gliding motility-associated-like protein
MVYNSNTSLTGTEGNAIIMFPGDLTCVTINSTTPEYYTNITWGLRPPPFPISITETASSCGSITLTASGGVSYSWDNGDTPDKATNTFHQSGPYIVTVTNADGCSTSASKTIKINPLPAVLISGDTTACGSVTLTASGGVSYLWDGGTAPNSAVNTFNSSGTYSVTVTAANGCSAAASANVTVNSLVAPSVDIAASPSDTICAGMPVSFTATALNGGAAPAFQWFRNNVAAATGATFTADSLLNNDVITCRLTSNNMCAVPLTATSNAVTITVKEMPTISVAKNIIVNGADPIRLNPVINGDIKTYIWTPAAGVSDPAIQNPFINPDHTTIYQLKVISSSGCEAEATVTVSVVKDELIIPNTFTPNGDGVNDTWDIGHLSEYRNATVDIYSRYGMRLFHSLGYGRPWDGTYNSNRLPVGTYYYIINLGEGNDKLKSGWVTAVR